MKKTYKNETALFCEQLAMILKSGMPLSDGIKAIASEVDSADYKNILETISADLDLSKPFSEALINAGIYDNYMINLVLVGEKSGYLDQVMEQLTIYYHRLDETKAKLKDAIIYPSVLIIMMVAVIAVLVIKVLSIFETVLNNLGSTLSSSASTLMIIGKLLAQYGLIILIVVIVVISILFLKATLNKTNKSLSALLNSFIMTRKLGNDIEVSQFAYALSLLMNSGYDTSETLKIVPNIINSSILKNKISLISKQLSKGISFDQALVESKIFKSIYNRLLTIGFKTGNGEKVMSEIAGKYEDEIDNSITRFLNIIEPLIIIVLAIIIGIILLSVMLPLMSIMSSIG